MEPPSTAAASRPCPHCAGDACSSLACLACGAVLEEPASADHFARFGLGLTDEIDVEQLELRYLKLSRLLHPDHQSSRTAAAQSLALTNSARLNEAYALLTQTTPRMEYLLSRLDPDALERTKALDPGFLMESMELSEAAEEARESGDAGALARLAAGVQAELDARRDKIAAGLRHDPPDIDRLAVLMHEQKVFTRILRDTEQAPR